MPLLAAASAAGPAPVPGGNADGGASFGAALQEVLAGLAGGDGSNGPGQHASDDGDSTTGAQPDLPAGAAGVMPALMVPGQNQVLQPGSGAAVPQPGTLAAGFPAAGSADMPAAGLLAAGFAAGAANGEASSPTTEAATAQAPAPPVGSAQAQPAQERQPGAVGKPGLAVPGSRASGPLGAEPPASNRPVTAQVRQQSLEPVQPQASLPGQGQVAAPTAPIQLAAAVQTAQPTTPFSAPSAAPGFASGSLAPQLAGPLFSLAAAGPGQHVMTLKVTPEDLGPVTVRAHIDGAGVRIELFAPGDAGRDALRSILHELRRSLSESGIAGSGLGTSLDLSDHGAPPGWDSNGHPGTREHAPRQPTAPAPAGTAAAVPARAAVVLPCDGAGSLDILA
ncbi:flagellar hook-length control protein FliK [Pseudarthrobacter sp. 1G09]|uniref:flagellar hook-length control protein FliK n=1 Tax=Pseudarthrobacter sp. 1G09 TaxID=3416178 RepID=UPI003CF9F19D